MSDLIEAEIAKALEEADASFGYNSELIRLVEGVATYRLKIDGQTFYYTDNDDLTASEQYLAHIARSRAACRAKAVLDALAADELSRLQSLSDQNRLTGGWRAVPETMTAEMKEAAWKCVTVGFVNGLEGKMDRFWRHVLAASPPLPDTGGWRDIESAPKDDRFLVFGGVSNSDLGGGDPVLVTKVERYQDDYRPERFNVCDTCYYSVWIEKPTHWQPLPSPPLPLPGGEEKR